MRRPRRSDPRTRKRALPAKRGSTRHREPTEDTTGNMTQPVPPAELADSATAAGAEADTESDA